MQNANSSNNDNKTAASRSSSTPIGGTDRNAMAPGDEAKPGTPGTGEDICRCCGGSGKMDGGKICEECGGTGKVTVGIGGA